MAKDNRIRLPSSGAGLTQFYDAEKSNFQLTPTQVIILIVLVIIIELLLHMQGSFIFNLG